MSPLIPGPLPSQVISSVRSEKACLTQQTVPHLASTNRNQTQFLSLPTKSVYHPTESPLESIIATQRSNRKRLSNICSTKMSSVSTANGNLQKFTPTPPQSQNMETPSMTSGVSPWSLAPDSSGPQTPHQNQTHNQPPISLLPTNRPKPFPSEEKVQSKKQNPADKRKTISPPTVLKKPHDHSPSPPISHPNK